MSGPILYLSSEDFNIQKGLKGDILCHNTPGISLILFYSTHCTHCQTVIPLFKKMPGTIGGCQFGMINVSTNKSIVEMSKNTVTPIKYVPFVVLYINGKPYMIYSGTYEEKKLKDFIFEVVNKLEQKQSFSKEKVKENPETGIPAYCIGKPLCGKADVCYLEFNTAYTGQTQKQ